MRTNATAKYIGTSARKINLVAALIRGRRVVEAQVILANVNKRATDPVGDVLKSALANAENNYNAKKADLMIESVFVGPGPTLKRFRPRAKGSASSIKKRTSHITVVLTDQKAIKPETVAAKAESKIGSKAASDLQTNTDSKSEAGVK
jgi:large subunit ribosomal protein L22